MQYSNLRKEVKINDWPYSHNLRTDCHFSIEKGKDKERAIRITKNPKTGRWNNSKKTTYARKVLFATGDDGKTYIMSQVGWAISVMQSNMRYSQEIINVKDERYQAISDAFDEPVTATINLGE